jgi:hypothetical protein
MHASMVHYNHEINVENVNWWERGQSVGFCNCCVTKICELPEKVTQFN